MKRRTYFTFFVISQKNLLRKLKISMYAQFDMVNRNLMSDFSVDLLFSWDRCQILQIKNWKAETQNLKVI